MGEKLSQNSVPHGLRKGSAQAQREFGNRIRQLMAIARLSRRVVASRELTKLLMKETVALVAQVLGADYVKFLVLLPHGKAFRAAAGWPEDLGSEAEIPVTADSVAGYTLRCGLPVIVQDRKRDPRFGASLAIDERDLVSGMSVVVGAQETPYGVLCAYSARKRAFGEKELPFLLAAAKTLGMVNEREATTSRLHSLQYQLLSASRASVIAELGTLLADQLNQPLTALINYLQACRGKTAFNGAPVPERFERAMDKVVAEAERAASIVRRFRECLPNGELHTLEEDLNRTLKEAASLALADAVEKRIEVRYRLDPKLPRVVIDPIQIQQVLYDLIRHAVGSLEEAEERQLILSTQLADGNRAEVQIEVTGTGNDPQGCDEFPQEFLSGVAIARSIIEAHGGRLWVSDSAERRATFHFTLPPSAG